MLNEHLIKAHYTQEEYLKQGTKLQNFVSPYFKTIK